MQTGIFLPLFSAFSQDFTHTHKWAQLWLVGQL